MSTSWYFFLIDTSMQLIDTSQNTINRLIIKISGGIGGPKRFHDFQVGFDPEKVEDHCARGTMTALAL